MIALKTTTSLDESSGSSSEGDEDDEMALISRKFKRFITRKKLGYRREHYKAKPNKEKEKEKEKDKDVPIYFEYKKLGYFKIDYP